MIKKAVTLLSGAALASALLVGCSEAEPATCEPQAMGAISLQSVESPLRGGGGGGGGGRSGGGGGGRSSSSGGGSKGGGGSYSKPPVGSKPSPGSGMNLPGSGRKSGYTAPKTGKPAPTYVRQSDGMWGPFIGGVLVGDMLSDAPEGCDD